ncbi:MAG: PAS domain-containing protein, partial [Leptospirales bacterium]|nr:PAS domain-containing protein [Leptospirales bacterium]
YLMKVDLGIDNSLFVDKALSDHNPFPGRMAPATAFNFICIGLALLVVWSRLFVVLPLLLVPVFILAWTSLLGYLYGLPQFFPVYTSMALHTSILFVVLLLGIRLIRRDTGIAQILTTRTTIAGVIGLRLLPLALIVPPVIGWLILFGQRQGLFDPIYGLPLILSTVSTTVILVFLIGWNTIHLHGQELRRKLIEEKFRLLSQYSSDAHLLLGAEGVMECNAAALKILGAQRREDVMGVHPAVFSPEKQPDGRTSAEKSKEMDAIARRQGFHRFEWMHRKLDGTLFPVEVTLVAVPVEEKLELLVVWHDLTAAKAQEAELIRAREFAEMASRAKSRFLASMSHELRTPLNAILGFSELLQEDAIENNAEKSIPDLKRINDAGRHLLALINTILDFSKIEAGKMDLDLETFDVVSLVRDTIENARPLAKAHQNALLFETDLALLEIHSDMGKVRQILFNLLSNAAKFTTQGEIRLSLRTQGSNVQIEVSDTGIGMSPEQTARIFEAFEQASETTMRDFGGSGLGLAITREYCRLLGGSIDVTSGRGIGSVFRFTLPMRSE